MSTKSSSRWHSRPMFLNLLFVFLSLAQSTLAVDLWSRSSSYQHNSSSFGVESNSKTKVTTEIPNTNLKTTLEGLKESGEFYTSKDLSSTFAFTSQNFNFVRLDDSNDVDLHLHTSTAYQEMDFGTAMTDSSAWNLLQLKDGNSSMYGQTLEYLFNVRSGNRLIRVPMGSSDYSTTPYTYRDDAKSGFSIKRASNIISVLQDAKKLNPDIKLMFSPWTAPSFWKSPPSLNGGELESGHEDDYAEYFLNTAQSFSLVGLRPYAFTTQNEPTFESTDYATMLMSPSQQASLGTKIRSKLDLNGFRDVLLIAHDNNFARLDEAVEAISDAPATFDGVAFHAYSGSIDAMEQFRAKTQNQDNWLTEWSTEVRNTTSAWDSMFFFLDSLFLPATNYYSRSVILWNTALDQGFGPRLPSVGREPIDSRCLSIRADSLAPDFRHSASPPQQAYCDQCVPSLEITPSSVSFYPQAHVLSSFSVATSSLKSFSGSKARRILQEFPTTKSKLNSTQVDCLQTQSFASSFYSDQLSKGENKRFGLILVNKCDDGVSIKIGVDDQVMKDGYVVKPGLTTLQFSMETEDGCSPNCGTNGPDPDWQQKPASMNKTNADGKDEDDGSSSSVQLRWLNLVGSILAITYILVL